MSGRRIHCITNPVTMGDVANVLLAAGGSAIMGRAVEEIAEMTALTEGTLLNTGVPDAALFAACQMAGEQANKLGHPVVLDPVGVAASAFRRAHLRELLANVRISVIRCNQEEACALVEEPSVQSGGIDSAVTLSKERQERLACQLARRYSTVAYVTGQSDFVSDGKHTLCVGGGDARIRRVTGGGCMLSALICLHAASGMPAFEAALSAGKLWKECASLAGAWTEEAEKGMGMFHQSLFDALDRLTVQRTGRKGEGK